MFSYERETKKQMIINLGIINVWLRNCYGLDTNIYSLLKFLKLIFLKMVSKEAQLAYKFHHILVEKITKVVHIYVENKIANDLNQTTTSFLETNYNRNNFDSSYLKDVKTKIDEFKRQHGGRFPSNLSVFDVTSTVALAQNLFPSFRGLSIWTNKSLDMRNITNEVKRQAMCLHNIRLIRNNFYGHLNFYEMQEVYTFVLNL